MRARGACEVCVWVAWCVLRVCFSECAVPCAWRGRGSWQWTADSGQQAAGSSQQAAFVRAALRFGLFRCIGCIGYCGCLLVEQVYQSSAQSYRNHRITPVLLVCLSPGFAASPFAPRPYLACFVSFPHPTTSSLFIHTFEIPSTASDPVSDAATILGSTTGSRVQPPLPSASVFTHPFCYLHWPHARLFVKCLLTSQDVWLPHSVQVCTALFTPTTVYRPTHSIGDTLSIHLGIAIPTTAIDLE